MWTKEMRELKMRRGYADVLYLMRAFNVRTDVIGYELLQTAIMSYLHNPDLRMEELNKIAFKNSPMPLEDEDACFVEMKRALQNINIIKLKRLDNDTVVFDFINNIASDVRMRKLIDIRSASEELTQVDENVTAVFCAVAIRMLKKHKDGFIEVLNHCAGRYGYDDIDDLIIDLYKVVKNSEYENELTMCEDVKEKLEKKQKIASEVQKDVENLVKVFINEYENMIF